MHQHHAKYEEQWIKGSQGTPNKDSLGYRSAPEAPLLTGFASAQVKLLGKTRPLPSGPALWSSGKAVDRNHRPFPLTLLGLHSVAITALFRCQVLCCLIRAQPGTWAWGNSTLVPRDCLAWLEKGTWLLPPRCGRNRYRSFCHCDVSQQYLWA